MRMKNYSSTLDRLGSARFSSIRPAPVLFATCISLHAAVATAECMYTSIVQTCAATETRAC